MVPKKYKDEFLASRDSLFRYSLGMLGNTEDAEDAIHDAYERLNAAISKGTVPVNMRSYLFSILRNLCLDRISDNKRYQEIDMDHAENPADFGRNLEKRDEVSLVKKFLKQLPETQRSVFILRDIEGFDYQEIVNILEMDHNNIRVNLSLARKKIRNMFEKLREYEEKK